MINTRILDAAYDYLAPATLEDALTALAAHPCAKILAGGTDLLIKLKTAALTDMSLMIDIKHIDGLDYAEQRVDGCFHIGPLAKLSRLEKEPYIIEHYPALADALHLMAAIAVRNMGTMAGNICNASPVADSVIPAICYGAQVTLQSAARGCRNIALEEFFLAPGVSVMEKDEMLVDIILPAPKANTGASFIKKTRVKPDIAKITAGVLLQRDGDMIVDCRIAMGAIAATPYFAKESSAALKGKRMTRQLIDEAAAELAARIRPIDDNRTTAEYRTVIAEIVLRDAISSAWANAGGEIK